MFKKALIYTFFALIVASAPLRALAVTLEEDPGAAPGKNFGLDRTAEAANFKDKGVKSSPLELFLTINNIVTGLLTLVGIIFFGMLTFAGVRWMTAKGNEEFVTKAKETMEAALIGLIIVMSAYAITNFVFSRVQGQTDQAVTAP